MVSDEERDELAYLVKEMEHYVARTIKLSISTQRDDALIASVATMADILKRLVGKHIQA